MNLVEEGKDAQPIFINSSLSSELRNNFFYLLHEYKDVCA